MTILDDVLERYAYSNTNLPFWGKMPAVVIRELTDNAFNGEIEYNRAVKILDSAKTPKMRGDANRGMTKIKELWRKNYLP